MSFNASFISSQSNMTESKPTLEFFESLFENATIKQFEEAPASERGDNYTAVLYRILLKGHKNDDENEPWAKSIIYKCLPESTARREAFKSDDLFKNEVFFYTKVMPLFQQYQDESSKGDKFDAVPNCHYAANNVIILDDLCAQGFQMADRKNGLNLHQMQTVLIELAKFHSISLALKIIHPERFFSLIGPDGIHEMLFIEKNKEWYREYYKQATQNAFEMVSKELDQNQQKQKYLGAFSNFLNDDFFEKMIQLVSKESELSVLCHGDCWTNNVLFKQTRNNTQVCFIDFQLCRYGSLALDLANLIYCCTTRSLREDALNLMLTTYLETLYERLNVFFKNTKFVNHKITKRDHLYKIFNEDFRRCSLFGLGLAIDMIPISTCESKNAPDLYSSEETEINIPGLSKNELCKTKMTNLVCELVDNEILN